MLRAISRIVAAPELRSSRHRNITTGDQRKTPKKRLILRQIAVPFYLLLPIIAAILLAPIAVAEGELPIGFAETRVATGLQSPDRIAIAPDGRIFVAEQRGRVRVVRNDVLLSAPFVTLNVDYSGERGLVGITIDPNYMTNHYVYVYYTSTTPAVHNRITRFTANGDVAVPGSERAIFELDNLEPNFIFHNAGAMGFGHDGKLYVAVGDNGPTHDPQTLTTLFGKVLRINSDGTIPADNPFYNQASGKNRAIWAYGLRNPFSFAIQPGTSRMFINDVGENTWEEVNDGQRGANYGWRITEGPTGDPRFLSPAFYYHHGSGNTMGCAVTGGTFYNPATNQFPASYIGKYFFMDYCNGWIRVLDPDHPDPTHPESAPVFAGGTGNRIAYPVDLEVASDGSLYYLSRGGNSEIDPTSGSLYKVRYTGSQAPNIVIQPTSQTITVGDPVTFTIEASGAQPLTYRWQRNGVNISGATSPSYTIPSVTMADNNARFRCIVTNTYGSVTSSEAVLTVTTNHHPTGTITAPISGTLYTAGETIQYAGTGTDPEDGTLPPSAFTWQVDFYHCTAPNVCHTHPFRPPISGSRTGQFTIPTSGETSPDVWYRIVLTVRDSGGFTDTDYHDIRPRLSTITLATNPTGLQITLDGQPSAGPLSVRSVVGMDRIIGAVSPQTLNGVTYQFVSWSDGGAATHTITVPANNTTYTANYQAIGGASPTPAATSTRTATRTATATHVATSTTTATATAAATNTAVSGTATPATTGTATAATTAVATATSPPPSQTGTSVPSSATPTYTIIAGSATATPTACTIEFQDVLPDNTFYPFVKCLACRGIVNGYPCGSTGEPCGPSGNPYFRPGNTVSRGQLAKIAAQSAGFNEPVTGQTFEDVAPGSTFYDFIERLASRAVMGGYPCGVEPNEPCVGPENRPYFRPATSATRGQLTKIVSNAAGFSDPAPATYTFTDVPPGSTFHIYVERLLLNRPGVMNGYPCGVDPNEPCDDQNRPYFRPNNPVSRGQASKIVANTFFPGCQTPIQK